MQINQIKFCLFMVILVILQLIINSTTMFYLDWIAVVLVMLLINNAYSIRALIAISLIADLIGHWYLGSHLLATILLSFLASYFVNFYKMSNVVQKNIILSLFYLLFTGILTLIGLITHNLNLNWLNLAVEICLLNPLILWLFNSYIIKSSSDILL